MDDPILMTWQSVIIVLILGGALCTLIFLLADMLQEPSFLRTHQKKTFTSQQDDSISEEQIQQRLERFRFRVQSGQVSEDIH